MDVLKEFIPPACNISLVKPADGISLRCTLHHTPIPAGGANQQSLFNIISL